MKIALYIAGRSKCYDKWLITQLNNTSYNIDIFASLNEDYNEKFIKDINPLKYNFEKYILPDKYTNVTFSHESTKPQNMCSMFYHNKKAFELIEAYSIDNNINYDIIIKFRPDFMVDNLPLICKIDTNSVYTPNHSIFGWPGINDMMAFGDYNSMKIYSNCYDYIDTYINNNIRFHPETILRHHLDTNLININEIDYQYSLDPDRLK